MKSWEVVGYMHKGQALCPECAYVEGVRQDDEDSSPYFASDEVDHDLTCDGCGEVLIEAPEPEPEPDYSVWGGGWVGQTVGQIAPNNDLAAEVLEPYGAAVGSRVALDHRQLLDLCEALKDDGFTLNHLGPCL